MTVELDVLALVGERLDACRVSHMLTGPFPVQQRRDTPIAADSTATVESIVADRYRAMTPLERIRAVCSLSETARQIVLASLSTDLSPQERRYALARRIYGADLPEAAIRAYAQFPVR